MGWPTVETSPLLHASVSQNYTVQEQDTPGYVSKQEFLQLCDKQYKEIISQRDEFFRRYMLHHDRRAPDPELTQFFNQALQTIEYAKNLTNNRYMTTKTETGHTDYQLLADVVETTAAIVNNPQDATIRSNHTIIKGKVEALGNHQPALRSDAVLMVTAMILVAGAALAMAFSMATLGIGLAAAAGGVGLFAVAARSRMAAGRVNELAGSMEQQGRFTERPNPVPTTPTPF